MAKRLLPIGTQTFRTIRERNCYYVDKTDFALRLVEEGTHYCLSRPRRFGKSLFLDTLKELLEGSREQLFEGLFADGQWDWSVRYPVVKLSFGAGNFKEPGYLQASLMDQLTAIERPRGIERQAETAPGRLQGLLGALHRRTGQPTAVLVDEYDKPILDALEVPETARFNRDYLCGLYSAIKDADAHVRFCFLTGVSKFSKVSLLSGLNNLVDITLDPSYSSICGYSDSDLDTVFEPEMQGLDRNRVRDWYNGYSWGGEETAYNPFDVLLLFRTRKFKAWWFETGTPAFLVETHAERRISSPTLGTTIASEDLLNTFDVGRIAPEALLFQTGYLTLVGEEVRGDNTYYRLGYPNREVRQSLNESLLDYLTGEPSRRVANSIRLGHLLREADFAGLEDLFRSLFAGIPHDWHRRNEIARYEGYYASIFCSYFTGLGLDVTVEDSGSAGRLDMAVRVAGRILLFELRVVEQAGPGEAMAQLKRRGYADKYRSAGEPIHLIAVEFSARTRNIAGFEVEIA